MGLGATELLLILLIVFVIFGAGKLPKVMNDIGKGVRGMKDGLRGDDSASPTTTVTTIDQPKKPE